MSTTELGRRMRSLLGETQIGFASLGPVLSNVDAFVNELRGSENDERLRALEADLQTIHGDVVARSDDPRQTELFLAALSRLSPIMSSSSIISDWFDVCLRPALRNSELSPAAVRHAKDLIITALHNTVEQYSKLVSDFRRRLLDLYLRDVVNEGSGEDVLEWAEMDQKERDVKTTWKSNLEEIILIHGSERPADLLDEVNDDYLRKPHHRLQLLTLLSVYTSRPSFSSEVALILASHSVLKTLLLSLQLDKSSTACTLGVTILVKVLPMLAMHAGDMLKDMIPRMLAVLARIMCFKTRLLPASQIGVDDSGSPELEQPETTEEARNAEDQGLDARADLHWKRLERSFQESSPPSPHRLFTLLYYLYPCNVIRFLRSPVFYLESHNVSSPYVVGWSDALDETQIKSKSEPLIQGHLMHPSLIWADADEELVSEGRWTRYDISRIIGECTMLDVRHARLAAQYRRGDPLLDDSSVHVSEETATPRMHPLELEDGKIKKPMVSVQDMLSTSLLLRSSTDVEIVGLAEASHTDKPRSFSLPVEHQARGVGSGVGDSNSQRIAEVLATLQREVILLRNELNLELWVNRENVKHIGRLYEEHVLSRNAEVERQALHNRLRQYKTTVATLQKNFASHEKSASNAQEKYLKWNQDLQSKLQARREEAHKFDSQTSSLRSENGDLKAKLEAQGKLLARATNRVFLLETQIKETAHKVDRLHDYERRIGQLTTTQLLWDSDVQKLKDQKAEMEVLFSSYKGMQLRLQSYEQSQSQLVRELSISQQRVRELELMTSTPAPARSKASWDTAASLAAAAAEQQKLDKENKVLRERAEDLQDEVEVLRAKLEEAKAMSADLPQREEE